MSITIFGRSLPSKVHLLYSAGLFFNHFAFGIGATITWPALVDLSVIYNVNEESISRLATFSSLGYLFGSLSGPLFYSRYVNRQLLISFLVALIALTLALLPHYSLLWLLFAAFTLNGFGGGSWDSTCSVWIVEGPGMWSGKGRSASAISALHTTYGVGAILGPLLVARYVFGADGAVGAVERRQALTVPFVIAGALLVVVPLLFFLLYFICPYKSEVKDVKKNNTESEGQPEVEVQPEVSENQHITLRPLKLALTALCLAFYASAELAYINFASTALQMLDTGSGDEGAISAPEAAVLQSILAATYALGRFLNAFAAIRLTPETIIVYHFILIGAGQVAVFCGRHSRVLVYGGTALLGAGFSAMWPAILALTERHLRLTHLAGTVLYFANGLLSLFSPLIVGPFLVDKPQVLWIFEGAYLGVSLLFFLILRLGLIKEPLRWCN